MPLPRVSRATIPLLFRFENLCLLRGNGSRQRQHHPSSSNDAWPVYSLIQSAFYPRSIRVPTLLFVQHLSILKHSRGRAVLHRATHARADIIRSLSICRMYHDPHRARAMQYVWGFILSKEVLFHENDLNDRKREREKSFILVLHS